VSDTKERLMKWIREEYEGRVGVPEGITLEVLIGILAGAIDGTGEPCGPVSLNALIKEWADYGVEVMA
tara:strand:+ start:134 stop:337 length:204 start_codon:yes stop_codon:yes gene_type:complete